MIESLLEHRPWWNPVASSSKITTVAGSAIITGTNLTTNYSVNDVCTYVDDAGILRFGQFKTITDATNAEFYTVARTVATAVDTTPFTGAALNHYWFEADNALIRNQIVEPSSDARENAILANPNFPQDSQISMNEGIRINSMYVRFPYQFTMADSQIGVSFYYVDQSGSLIGRIESIGEDSSIYIVRENGEISLSVYVPPPIITYPGHAGIAADTTWQISAIIQNCAANLGDFYEEDQIQARVSAVNAPDVLNGQFVPVYVGIKIVHAATPIT